MYAAICVIQYACFIMCAPECVLLYVCSWIHAPVCVLLYACSCMRAPVMHAPVCVLLYVCSCMRAPVFLRVFYSKSLWAPMLSYVLSSSPMSSWVLLRDPVCSCGLMYSSVGSCILLYAHRYFWVFQWTHVLLLWAYMCRCDVFVCSCWFFCMQNSSTLFLNNPSK